MAAKTRYEDLLQRLHWTLLPRTYVEIGVHHGGSLQLTAPNSAIIAIDPEPKLTSPPPPRVQLFPITSDAFFDENHPRALLGNRTIDLAFIDGMHLFEYAFRDFINLERSMTSDGVVVIDDCYPAEPDEAARERFTPRWTGDIWKLIVCLRRYRPELDVRVIDVAPAGVGIVTGLDPSSTVLADAYDDIVAEYVPLGYEAIEGHEREQLNLQPYDWPEIRRSLPRVPFSRPSALTRAHQWRTLGKLQARTTLPDSALAALARLRGYGPAAD